MNEMWVGRGKEKVGAKRIKQVTWNLKNKEKFPIAVEMNYFSSKRKSA